MPEELMLDEQEEEKKEPELVRYPAKTLSPSQMKVFFNCKRQYFYQYIKKIPTKPKFALSRGILVHTVAENCFDMEIDCKWSFEELCNKFKEHCMELFDKYWKSMKIKEQFGNEGYQETKEMIEKFVMLHVWQMEPIYKKKGSILDAWKWTRPFIREAHIVDKELGLQGHIDSIIELGDTTIIVDYKTSKIYKSPFSKEYEMQGILYALLYARKTDKIPDYVTFVYVLYGVYAHYQIKPEMLHEARVLVSAVHKHIRSDKLEDYPINPKAVWCEYCDYKEQCHSDGNPLTREETENGDPE